MRSMDKITIRTIILTVIGSLIIFSIVKSQFSFLIDNWEVILPLLLAVIAFIIYSFGLRRQTFWKKKDD